MSMSVFDIYTVVISYINNSLWELREAAHVYIIQAGTDMSMSVFDIYTVVISYINNSLWELREAAHVYCAYTALRE